MATVSLLTFAFPRTQVEILVDKLCSALTCDDIVHTKSNAIRLNKKASQKFLDYIGGKAPVKWFNYKSDPIDAVTEPKRAI